MVIVEILMFGLIGVAVLGIALMALSVILKPVIEWHEDYGCSGCIGAIVFIFVIGTLMYFFL